MTTTNASKLGMQWCTAALDPFHDNTLLLAGMPDDTTGYSVVRVHNQSATLSSTVDGGYGYVAFNGGHGSATSDEVTMPYITGGRALVGRVASDGFGPICVIDGATVEPDVTALNTTYASRQYFGTTLDPAVPSRLIAIGIEVRDVTADLYKQGVIHCATANGAESHTMVNVDFSDSGDDTVYYGCPTIMGPAMSQSVATLTANPNVFTTASRNGVYATGRLLTPQKPVSNITGRGTYCPSVGADSAVSAVGPQVSVIDYEAGWPLFWSGFAPFEIRISGMSASSVYSIKMRTVVEYFPDYSDLQMLGLASAACPPDPMALRHYWDTAARLPFGTEVKNNASGDWWRTVLKVLHTASPALDLFVPGLGKLARVGAGAILSIADRKKVIVGRRKKQPARRRVANTRRGPVRMR